MDLRKQILLEHSRANCNRIVQWIGSNQLRFNMLFTLFLHDEYRVVQRAAWALSIAVINHPALINGHFSALIKNLSRPGIHDAVKRNTVRLLQDIEIPKKYHGEIMDICFRYISSPSEKVAIKAFSMSVLATLAKKYPDIKNELKLLIEERRPHELAAFDARARKILKDL